MNYKGILHDKNYENMIHLCNAELKPYVTTNSPIFYSLNTIIDAGYIIYYGDDRYSVFDITEGCQHAYGGFYPNQFNFNEC